MPQLRTGAAKLTKEKNSYFLPLNFCGTGDGTWLSWALYCGVSHGAANEASVCQGWVSEAPAGKDPLPRSCGCWQDLVPHRLPDWKLQFPLGSDPDSPSFLSHGSLHSTAYNTAAGFAKGEKGESLLERWKSQCRVTHGSDSLQCICWLEIRFTLPQREGSTEAWIPGSGQKGGGWLRDGVCSPQGWPNLYKP